MARTGLYIGNNQTQNRFIHDLSLSHQQILLPIIANFLSLSNTENDYGYAIGRIRQHHGRYAVHPGGPVPLYRRQRTEDEGRIERTRYDRETRA